MNLSKQERQYKEYIQLERRYWDVEEKLRAVPYTPLKEPFQRGWDIYFDFRSDIKNRRDFPAIKRAFDLCHSAGYTKNVTFVKRIRNNRSLRSFTLKDIEEKRYGYGVFPVLVPIRERIYEGLAKDVARYFYKDVESEKWKAFRGSYYRVDIPRYYLELKVKPHIVTHKRDKNSELEKEADFLRKKLEGLWRLYSHNYSSSYPANKGRAQFRSQLSKFKKGEIEDIPIEKIERIYDW